MLFIKYEQNPLKPTIFRHRNRRSSPGIFLYTEGMERSARYLSMVMVASLIFFLKESTPAVFAQELSQGTYEIQNATADFVQTTSSTQTKQSLQSVLSGAEYERFKSEGAASRITHEPLVLGIDDSVVLFDESGGQRNAAVTISADPSERVWMNILQSAPMKTLGGDEIANTTCDYDSSCGVTHAGRWVRSSTYGLGYRVNSAISPDDFLTEDFYRPMPLTTAGGAPQLISFKNIADADHRAIITFKLNKPPFAPAATYQSTVQLSGTVQY